jgi:hypothetical protein
MNRYKFGFRNRSAAEQLLFCERLLVPIAALPPERRSEEYLTNAQGVVAETRASENRIGQLRAELKAEISRRKELLPKMRNATIRIAMNVAILCQHDAVKMMEIGLELEAPKNVRVGPPGAVNIRGEASAREGEVVLRWKRPLRNCIFEVQLCVDPLTADKWKQCNIALRQTSRVKGLQSGVKYWFRVRASNANGEGPWSNPVAVRVR